MSVLTIEPTEASPSRWQPIVRLSSARWIRFFEHVVLAVVAYVPLLCAAPGVVSDDTKTYLYLDPTRFLRRVSSLWDPSVGLGSVTHEYIGYLLPMGPFFALFHVLGVPVWIAQRLWLGSILFAAGSGILYLCRTFDLAGPGRLVAAGAFMLSPYFLQYSGRISVILLPWAGLGWLVAFAAKSVRFANWRYPALFALVVALVSGINASSIIYVGIAPAAWVIYVVVVEHETTWQRALGAAARISVLTLVVCLWWIVGLDTEAAFGVDVLKFTETVPSTSATSVASEVLRGLGYWYFYGQDRLGPWTLSSVMYTESVPLISFSFAIPVLSFFTAVLVRWRHRAYFVAVIALGLVFSVGPHPFESPTPFGHLLRSFMTDTTAGLALRSTDRATPLVVLGIAMLLGIGTSALWHRLPRIGMLMAVAVGALILLNNPALFDGNTIAHGFTEPASLPNYEVAAARYLNSVHKDTRVLEVPGDDFAAQRWGDTVDTSLPALLTRPFAIREQQIMGSLPTADLLYALDEPLQQGTFNPNSLAPLASLMSAGDVVLQSDTAYERYGIIQPQLLEAALTPTPNGLSAPRGFGAPVPNVPSTSMLNEADLAASPDPHWPSPLEVYAVKGARALNRAESNSYAVVVDGDATGLDDIAGVGLLNTDGAVYYAGTLDSHPNQERALEEAGATLVLTDTNRKQAFRWDTVIANTGYTETPDEHPEKTDLSDSPIILFPKAPADNRTTAFYVGALNVTASSYGNPVSYTPENRAFSALDNNLDTAWSTATFVPNPAGQWWQVALGHRVRESHITLIQPQRGDVSRHITKITLTFDGKHPFTTALTASSRAATGQVVNFPVRSFTTMRITIDATSDDTETPAKASAVGFAEVEIPGVSVQEVLQMPNDLLHQAGSTSAQDRLVIVMTRDRISASLPRQDPQTVIDRRFSLPTARTFTLSGTARISALIPDDMIDRLVGAEGYPVAYSSGRLPGDLNATASATIDSNPGTAWAPGFGAPFQLGTELHYDFGTPETFDHLNMSVDADGRHSVPSTMTISNGSTTATIDLPPVADSRTPGSVAEVPVNFPTMTGTNFTVTFTAVRDENTTNFDSPTAIALPLGIAEIGFPGILANPIPTQLPGTCISGLVDIDGTPLDLAVEGSTANALNQGGNTLVPCGADAHGIRLGAGNHTVTTALGHSVGWNVDQIVLDSAAGGTAQVPAPEVANGFVPAPQRPAPAATVTTTANGSTSIALAVHQANEPFELVMGQSINAGWTATASGRGHTVHLGDPELIDGYANGWPVSASDLAQLGQNFTVALHWTPQRKVDLALLLSGLGLLLCCVLGFAPRRARRYVKTHLDNYREYLPWAHVGQHAAKKVRTSAFDIDIHQVTPPPVLTAPWARIGSRPHLITCVLIAVAAGGVSAAIYQPLAGLIAGALCFVALLWGPARTLSVVGAIGFVVTCALEVILGEAHHHYTESSNWPSTFEMAGHYAWLAVIALGVDAVVVVARSLSRRVPADQRHGEE